MADQREDDDTPPTGLTRRQALKAGALLGAAAWVVPAVQVIGMTPSGAETTSGGGGGGSVPFPSHAEVLVTRSGSNTTYGVKYDQADDEPWGGIPENEQMCAKQSGAAWTTANSATNAFRANAVVQSLVQVGGSGYYRIQIPAGYAFVSGWAKCGQSCRAATLAPGTTDTFDFACQ